MGNVDEDQVGHMRGHWELRACQAGSGILAGILEHWSWVAPP
jgi:hypothetical protein